MEDDFNRWLEYAQWRGQTVQALKDITAELKELKEQTSKIEYNLKKDMTKLQDDSKKRDMKTAEIAGGTAVIVVVIGWIITTLL